MDLFVYIVSFVCGALLFCFFLQFRNYWVFKQKKLLIKKTSADCVREILDGTLNKTISEYWSDNFDKKYWSYGKMVLCFWIWDINKMEN